MSDPQLFTTKEVATRLRISKRTVERLIHKGELRIVKIGDLVRIAPADVEDYIARQRGKR